MGPHSFISTLNELKKYLKFNLLMENLDDNPNIILFHTDAFKDKKYQSYINNTNSIKISVGKKKRFNW